MSHFMSYFFTERQNIQKVAFKITVKNKLIIESNMDFIVILYKFRTYAGSYIM